MSEWLVYTAAGDYYALAQNEKLRDHYLRELMIVDHREGGAKPLPPADPAEVARSIAAFEQAYQRAVASQPGGERECLSRLGLAVS